MHTRKVSVAGRWTTSRTMQLLFKRNRSVNCHVLMQLLWQSDTISRRRTPCVVNSLILVRLTRIAVRVQTSSKYVNIYVYISWIASFLSRLFCDSRVPSTFKQRPNIALNQSASNWSENAGVTRSRYKNKSKSNLFGHDYNNWATVRWWLLLLIRMDLSTPTGNWSWCDQ